MSSTGRSSARSAGSRRLWHLAPETGASKNHYDRGRVTCTCDDRKTAAQLGGHTWNIINNKTDGEVFMLHARNHDHFVDEKGNLTSHWFEKKKRIDLDGDGVIDCVDSTNVEEVMRCPPTAGKQAKQLQVRAVRQLYQAAEPTNFGAYSARRATSSAAPPTPQREAMLERIVPFQDRLRDLTPRPTPRIVNKQSWAPRRGEPENHARPPPEHVMYRAVDQLRTENHIDARDPSFADSLKSARADGLGATGNSAVAGGNTLRSSIRADLPVKPAAEKHCFSKNRIEDVHLREISGWPSEKHNLKKEDHYHAKPVAHSGSSSVKYDLITNERKSFWY